jgi:hypothetical protein
MKIDAIIKKLSSLALSVRCLTLPCASGRALMWVSSSAYRLSERSTGFRLLPNLFAAFFTSDFARPVFLAS